LLHALDRRSFDVARFLIEHGADVNMSNRGGTPLHVAISQHAHELVQLLIDRGAEVCFDTVVERSGTSSLYVASSKAQCR